jgi:hypothetical protein
VPFFSATVRNRTSFGPKTMSEKYSSLDLLIPPSTISVPPCYVSDLLIGTRLEMSQSS